MSDIVSRLNRALDGFYRVERELDQGGMATVYLATDLRHERQVAVKVLRPEIASALGPERFLAEIRTTANLQHPNILPLHDSGNADGLLYYVMPYVEGETLEQRMARQGRIPIEEAVGIAVEVAEALHAAHEKGVVHRDVKPANILLSRGRPLVADFGIAYAANQLRKDRLTATGLSLGTPHYMSPEQISGEPVDGRSDVYTLACVLYEMLAGSPPFAGSTGQAILAGHVAGPVPRLRAARAGTSAALAAVIEQGLAKLPDHRWPTALAFAQALRRPRVGGLSTPAGRRRIGVVVLGLAALGLGLWLRPRLTGGTDALDPNRILVFPLVVSEGFPGPTSTGEDVATMIGTALDGAGPLRWIDGWAHLTPALREDVRGLSQEEAEVIARRTGCRRYVTGRIYAMGDSAVVSLVLSDLDPGRDPVRAQATAPLEEAWRGAWSVNLLLPEVIPGGGLDALAQWTQRPPRAMASYLLGEAAFRRIRLEEALEHYRSAVSADSSFALAAIRGAQAASWAHREAEAAVFLETALREDLEPRYAAFARGYQAYLKGVADSAIAAFREALSLDPEMTPAWLQLGETWAHLLPKAGVPDDSALAAFNHVIRLDSTSTNALFHTIEVLLRRGDTVRARPLVDRLVQADPEGAYADEVQIMFECVRLGPALVPWEELAKEMPFPLLAASMQLSGGGAQLPCAKAGLSALLRGDTAPGPDADGRRFFALLTLQNALLAQGRDAEALARVQEHIDRWGSGTSLFLLSAPFYESYLERAREVAAEDGARYGPAYTALGFPVRLWELGVFEARLGRPEIAARIAEELANRERAGLLPQGEELAASVHAHITLAAGDTAGALMRLESLVPAVAAGDLIRYDEALALGAERLEYGRLLASRGEYVRTVQVLDVFDSPWPAVHLLYLRPSLTLRREAAAALGDRRLEALYRARLDRLDRDEGHTH